jgi:hypothetical protein
LEDITQQLLESKHIFTLGQLFQIAPNLTQYIVTKLVLGKKNMTVPGFNSIITLVVIDPLMAEI